MIPKINFESTSWIQQKLYYLGYLGPQVAMTLKIDWINEDIKRVKTLVISDLIVVIEVIANCGC